VFDDRSLMRALAMGEQAADRQAVWTLVQLSRHGR
jgi:hypothetical protein